VVVDRACKTSTRVMSTAAWCIKGAAAPKKRCREHHCRERRDSPQRTRYAEPTQNVARSLKTGANGGRSSTLRVAHGDHGETSEITLLIAGSLHWIRPVGPGRGAAGSRHVRTPPRRRFVADRYRARAVRPSMWTCWTRSPGSYRSCCWFEYARRQHQPPVRSEALLTYDDDNVKSHSGALPTGRFARIDGLTPPRWPGRSRCDHRDPSTTSAGRFSSA
jgi:hypothetical protein